MSGTVVCIGLATLDTIFVVPSQPDPDGRVVASELAVAGGGPAATAAVTLARLGIDVHFVGAVGDDEVGAAVREGLEREGVDVSELAVVAGARSPQSSILVAGTRRAIVHYPGTLPPRALSEGAHGLCREASWVHVDHAGYAALPQRTDLGDAHISIDGGNPIDGLDLMGVTLYAPTEARIREDFGESAAALEAGAAIVVVTRGEEGGVAYIQDGTIEAPGYPVDVDVISTLGAGDVFHGALLAWLVRGATLGAALHAANIAASLSCRALDGRTAIPTAGEVEERSSAWRIASQ